MTAQVLFFNEFSEKAPHLNGVEETLISQALNDMDISHKEFITILKEKYKYESMKDNLRSENGEYISNDIICKQCIKL